MTDKKGISPVISSILLIVFAAGLGTVVMSWGRNVEAVRSTAESCEEASVAIVEVQGQPQACYTPNEIRLTIENDGQVPLHGFKVSLLGEGISQVDIEREVAVGEITKILLPLESGQSVQKIKVVPQVTLKRESQFCPKQDAEIENIGACP